MNLGRGIREEEGQVGAGLSLQIAEVTSVTDSYSRGNGLMVENNEQLSLEDLSTFRRALL